MSDKHRRKVTIRSLQNKKASGEPIVALGVYDAPMAQIADRVGFDLLVNGNAGPMSLLGHRTPLKVRYDEQLVLTQAVSRVVRYGFIVSHLPFMTYHKSKSDAIGNAARMVSEGGADAVKCEGTAHTAEHISNIVDAGIPVVGHIGMQASRMVEQSGYGKKGKTAHEAAKIVKDARTLANAGVCAFIVEQVPCEVTKYLAQTLNEPVLGVVAGRDGDGIYDTGGDLVGYTSFPAPRDKTPYANVAPIIEEALQNYSTDARHGLYPQKQHDLAMDSAEYETFRTLVD